MFLYITTIALSAFLLFLVQPMIAKVILPWFGGSAAVWTTALMFFQITLLAGYAYSHVLTSRLKPRTQAAVHIFLLAVSLLVLPVIPSPAFQRGGGGDPTLWILLLLAATVGMPYFLLSSTSPLLQAWYASQRKEAMPYRLFAVSNAGSLLALISFPLALEPFVSSRAQEVGWSAVYAVFVAMCGLVAFGMVRRKAGTGIESPMDEGPAPSSQVLFLWIAMPACASALLLSITTHLTQNVAPMPFLWVLTLTLYLASFILCFESDRFYHRIVFMPLLAAALVGMSYAIYDNYGNQQIKIAIPLFGAGLFVCCMVCHGEVARLKPHTRYLTRFYLSLALGGAVGGLFVAVVAPHVFQAYLELPVALVVCAMLAAYGVWNQLRNITLRMTVMLFVVVLAGYLSINEMVDRNRFLAGARNFYGLLRVSDKLDSGESTAVRKLLNGTIIHGQQLSDARFNRLPTSYYGPESGVGRSILLFQQMQKQVRVGVIGLGAGVLASYCRPGDSFRFYEINPLDIEFANRYFTFLKDCGPRCEISRGDARLVLQQQTPQEFDVLAVDAFSSDAIPIHLLTREAFGQYFRHLRKGGILAVHVTNRYLNLVPVVARAGEEFQKQAFEVSDTGEARDYWSASDWMLVGPDTHVFVLLGFHGAPIIKRGAPRSLRTWTDDFSNLFQILK